MQHLVFSVQCSVCSVQWAMGPCKQLCTGVQWSGASCRYSTLQRQLSLHYSASCRRSYRGAMAAAAAAAQGEAEFKFRLRTAGRGVRSPLPQPGGATGPGRSPLPAAGERGVFRVRSAECRVQCSESDCLRTVDRLVDSCGQLERVVDRSVVDSLVRTVVDREFVYTVYARPAECQTGRARGKTTAASYLPSCSGLRSSAVRCITEW